jgi:hypothetical protein
MKQTNDAGKRSLLKAGRGAAASKSASRRYSCVLLFRFEVGPQLKRYGPLLHEFRVCVFKAKGSQEAHRKAMTYGKKHSTSYTNPDGEPVRLRFMRVVDCIDLSDFLEGDEVEMWYDYVVAKPSDVASTKVKKLPLRRFE